MQMQGAVSQYLSGPVSQDQALLTNHHHQSTEAHNKCQDQSMHMIKLSDIATIQEK